MRRTTTAISRLLVLLALWCCPTVATAEASAADKAAAEALFKQAQALADEGRYGAACPKFAASQQLDAGLGTLLHLADCYEKLGKLASAWATFEQAISVATARGEQDRATIARVRAAALLPQLSQLVLNVPTELPEGFEVQQNGVPVPPAAFGSPVPVDPGTWLIRASAPNHQPFETSVTVVAGQLQPYTVSLPELIENPPPDPLPATSSTDGAAAPDPSLDKGSARPRAVRSTAGSQRTLGLIIGSAGLIAGVVSGVYTIMALSSNSDSKDLCDPRDLNRCSVPGKQERDEALSQANVATITGIIGFAGVAAGATLYFTAPPRLATDSPEPTGAMVGLKGTW